MLMDPLIPRSHAFTAGAHIISVRFLASWQGLNYIPPLCALQVIPPGEHPELLNAAMELAQSPRATPAAPAEFCLKQTRFYAWLHQWHQTRKKILGTDASRQQQLDPRVIEIMTWISSNRHSRVIAYPELSQVIGLSKAQIDRIFLKETGITIHQWIDNDCRRLAEVSLANPNLSIKEISSRLHFTTASHFSKWFLSHTGTTPREWRKRHCSTPS